MTKPIRTPSQQHSNDKIIVGRFGAAFGIKGWIKVLSYTDPITNLLDYSPWYIQANQNWQIVEIEDGRVHGDQLIVKLPGCDTRNMAETFTHLEIAITAETLPKLENNEFYWSDLIGLKVINLQNEDLGTVTELMATGSNDVLIVQGDKERLIPYTKHAIIKVDLATHCITVDWDSSF